MKLSAVKAMAINVKMRDLFMPDCIAIPSMYELMGEISFVSFDESMIAYTDVIVADINRRNSIEERKMSGIYPKKGMIIKGIKMTKVR